MFSIFQDAFIDTLKMLPLLFVVYFIIELIEYKYSKKLKEKIEKAGNAGPIIGSLVGAVPQCGFSVIASALYTQRLLTIGTLIAVYISTSDEAIPIILSQPEKAGVILPLILTKIGIAVFAGYLVDLFYKRSNRKVTSHISKFESGDCNHNHGVEEIACCGHDVGDKLKVSELIIHPLTHTIKVFLYILTASFLINFIFYKVGSENLSTLFLGHSIFQPVLASIIGLIPNCAASVAITQLYLSGTISYGSTIAGLAAGGGLGVLVLAKENHNAKNTLAIVGMLLAFSIISGIFIQYFYG